MKRYGDSITRRLLTAVIMVLVALTFLGCSADPMVKEMEARRQEVGFFIEQELQRCRNATKFVSRPASLPPAQAADMETERRELDRMVQRGEWDNLISMPSTAQAELFYQAP